ncbi:RNA methyltransferase, partial [Yersinia pestis PY-13]
MLQSAPIDSFGCTLSTVSEYNGQY